MLQDIQQLKTRRICCVNEVVLVELFITSNLKLLIVFLKDMGEVEVEKSLRRHLHIKISPSLSNSTHNKNDKTHNIVWWEWRHGFSFVIVDVRFINASNF